MTTTVCLVRHGATGANLDNRFAGRTDEALHRQGREQAEELGRRFAAIGLHRIVCGPLARTVETAAIIAAATGSPRLVDARLTEIDLPHWDGLTKDEIRARFGPEYPTWLESPQAFAVAGCETVAAVQRRAVAAVEELFAGHPGQRLLVVSHLIVIRSLLLHYLGMEIARFRTLKVGNGEVVRLVRRGDGTTEVARDEGVLPEG